MIGKIILLALLDLNAKSRSSYADADVGQLKALLFNYDDQTARFKRIKTSQDVGLLCVTSEHIEARLRPSPQR